MMYIKVFLSRKYLVPTGCYGNKIYKAKLSILIP